MSRYRPALTLRITSRASQQEEQHEQGTCQPGNSRARRGRRLQRNQHRQHRRRRYGGHGGQRRNGGQRRSGGRRRHGGHRWHHPADPQQQARSAARGRQLHLDGRQAGHPRPGGAGHHRPLGEPVVRRSGRRSETRGRPERPLPCGLLARGGSRHGHARRRDHVEPGRPRRSDELLQSAGRGQHEPQQRRPRTPATQGAAGAAELEQQRLSGVGPEGPVQPARREQPLELRKRRSEHHQGDRREGVRLRVDARGHVSIPGGAEAADRRCDTEQHKQPDGHRPGSARRAQGVPEAGLGRDGRALDRRGRLQHRGPGPRLACGAAGPHAASDVRPARRIRAARAAAPAPSTRARLPRVARRSWRTLRA